MNVKLRYFLSCLDDLHADGVSDGLLAKAGSTRTVKVSKWQVRRWRTERRGPDSAWVTKRIVRFALVRFGLKPIIPMFEEIYSASSDHFQPQSLLALGLSPYQIADMHRRSPSTIRRQLKGASRKQKPLDAFRFKDVLSWLQDDKAELVRNGHFCKLWAVVAPLRDKIPGLSPEERAYYDRVDAAVKRYEAGDKDAFKGWDKRPESSSRP